jgi:hypothetical protein
LESLKERDHLEDKVIGGGGGVEWIQLAQDRYR